jgi:hypothetical protein
VTTQLQIIILSIQTCWNLYWVGNDHMIRHYCNDSFARGLTDTSGVIFMENFFYLSCSQNPCISVKLFLMYRCQKKKRNWQEFVQIFRNAIYGNSSGVYRTDTLIRCILFDINSFQTVLGAFISSGCSVLNDLWIMLDWYISPLDTRPDRIQFVSHELF